MINALLVIHIILAICMIGLVLIQKSEGGALGMGGGSGGGGMGGFMSARGTANLLTRTTAVLATLFFMTTLGLAVLYKGGSQKSILDGVEASKTTGAPAKEKNEVPGVNEKAVAGSPDPAEQAKAKTEAAMSKETAAPSTAPAQETKKETSNKTS